MEIVSLIKLHKVMIYSLANCPYCIKAKDLLTISKWIIIKLNAIELKLEEHK